MLKQRLLVTGVLLPVGLLAIFMGGWFFTLLITTFLALAAWEYSLMMNKGGYRPWTWLVVGSTIVISISRYIFQFQYSDLFISLIILAAITYHLVSYETGRDQAGTDFAVTLGGIFYIGWIGAYLISLREIPDGRWWFLVVLPATWLADAGAYFIGSRFGKHFFSPRISPKKTWEGYFGGIIVGTLGTLGFTLLWQLWGSGVAGWQGALIGFIMSAITTLGDLAESVFKRQVGVKDSGNLLPGHGGFFDRIDSWIWAAVIGYYLIIFLW